MSRFLPPHAVPVAFGLPVSGIMTFIVSGISVYQVEDPAPRPVARWMSAWVVAFPVIQ